MESFWQGMVVRGVRKENQDLIIGGEKIKLPCAGKIILERESPSYSKDIKLAKKRINPRLLGEWIIGKHFLFGMKFNTATKRYEVIQIALTDGWCWDET